MLWTSYPDGSRETWTYHSTYNVATSYTFTPPSGSGEDTLKTVYTVDGTTGNVTRERQVSNLDDSVYSSDATANPDIVIDYTYTDGTETGTPPKGLVKTVTFTSHPDAPVTSYEYNSHGKLEKVTLPDPDGAGSLTAPVTDYVWNTNGTLASVTETDAGATFSYTTNYEYDDAGRVTEVKSPDPDGTGALPRPVVQYTYNADGSIATMTETTDAAAASTAVTSYAYTNGQLTTVTYPDPDGSGPQYSPVTEYVYTNGLLTHVYEKSADPSGESHLTQHVYDEMNRVRKTYSPDPDGAGPLEQPIERYYYDNAGRMYLTRTDNPDLYTDYAYDAMGRLTSVKLPDPDTLGGTNRPTTSYTYYATGQVKTMTDPLGAVTSYDYNDLGQLVKVTLPDPDGTGALYSPTQAYTYDTAGRMTAEIQSHTGSGAVELTTSYSYDTLDRVKTVTLPDPDGSGTTYASPVQAYQYDPAGHLKRTLDASGAVTEYTHDALGRRTREITSDPDMPLDGLIGHWRFDETEGLVAVDDSSGGDDADLLTTDTDLPLRIAGFEGNALDFNGTSAYAKAEDVNVDTTLGAQHTLAFWMRWDSDTSAVPFDLGGINLFIAGSTFTVNTGAGDMLGTSINGFAEQWVHVAVVVTNGTPSAQNTKIYLNGEEQQLAATGNAPRSRSVGSTVYFGKSQDTDPRYYYLYDGALDDIRYYTGELSPEEVAALARPAAGGLVTHWTFDESSGTTASDRSGHHIEATLSTYGTEYPTWVNDGKIEGALEFDGDDAYGELHDVPINALDGAKNTVAFWMKWDGSSQQLPMSFDKMNLAIYGNWIGINTYVGDFLRTPAGSITSGEWIHVAAIFNNGEITADTCKIYLNGQEQALTQTKDGGSYVPNRSVNRHIFLGKAHWYDAYQFDGKMDDFRVYNRELSSEDVSALVGLREVPDGRTTYYGYDEVNNLDRVQASSGELVAWTYDNLHRSTSKTVDPGGLSMAWSYAYDTFSNLTQVTDPKSHTTTHAYDGLNRLLETTLHNGADTVYAYDNLGNLASVTDPTDNVTSYTYDYLHRMRTETITVSASPRVETYWYDLADRLISKRDRLDRVLRYDFDQLGRVYQERWKDSVGGTTVRTITYDFDDLGRLTQVADPSATYDYTYDNLSRVTQSVHDIAGLTPDVTFAQTFNAVGNRTQLAATIGTTADFVNDFSYDALGQMTQVTQQGQSGGNAVAEKLIDFDYSPTGQFSQIRRYADLLENEYVARTDFSYDPTGRLTGLTHNGGGLASSIDYSLGYDDHLLDVVTYGGKTLDYSYDTVDQLTNVDYTGTGTPTDESYTLDGSGNRTNSGYTTGDHNRLTADGTYAYTYDHNGNRTARFVDTDSSGTLNSGDTSITEYTWDHRNRLTSATDRATYGGAAARAVEYGYDAFNRLVHKQLDADGDAAGAATDTFWIHDGNQAVLQFDGNTAADLSHRYLWGPAVDQLLADETVDDGGPEDILWPLTDWQGSVRHLASYNAATNTTTIENEKFYDAYGNVTSETNSAVDTLFAYTGRLWDDDTALQNNLNRWYDPEVGRWLSPDPIKFEALDPNLYRYVRNSPGMRVDPSGLYDGYWTEVGRTAKGYFWTGPASVVSGVWNSAIHPIETSKGLATAALHPIDTVTAIKDDIVEKAQTSEGQGQLGFDIATTICPAGLAAKAKYAQKIRMAKEAAEAARVAKLAARSEDASKAAEVIRAARLADEANDAARVARAANAAEATCPSKAPRKIPLKYSLDYVCDTHVDRVKGPKGTHKIGESAQGVRVRDGASIRGEQQARRLTRETGDVPQIGHSKDLP